ncbi:MAG: hypothetical protein ACKO96_33400, partial [Flammeovirgaceae bacterium]
MGKAGVIDYSPITNILDRAQRLNDADAWLFAFSHKDLRDEIIRLNTENQLFEEGIDSEGRDLGEYRPFTIEVKRKTGLPWDHVTLFQTGEFYASFRVTYDANGFSIDANGDKPDKNLFDVYGDNVLGLTSFNMERIKTVILQYYVKYVEETLFR